MNLYDIHYLYTNQAYVLTLVLTKLVAMYVHTYTIYTYV